MVIPLISNGNDITALTSRLEQETHADRDAQPGEPVAPARIERQVITKIVRHRKLAANVGRHTGINPPIGINGSGESVVRIAQQPAPVFDRSHTSHDQTLSGSRGAPQPAVIRDIDQEPRAGTGETPYLVGKHCLVTDKNAETPARQIAHSVTRPVLEIPGQGREILGEPQKAASGDVFAERNLSLIHISEPTRQAE